MDNDFLEQLNNNCKTKEEVKIANDKGKQMAENQRQDYFTKEQSKAEDKLNEYYVTFVESFKELCIKAVSNALYLEDGGKKQLKGCISVTTYKSVSLHDDGYHYTSYLCGKIYKPQSKKTFWGNKIIWSDQDGVDTSVLLYQNMAALKLFSTPTTYETILQDICNKIHEKTDLVLMIKNIIPTIQFDEKWSKVLLNHKTDVVTNKLEFTFTF